MILPKLNGFNYCYQTFIIISNINHLFAHSKVFSSIAIYGWLVVLFYGTSILFGSINAELNFKQFNLA